VSGEVLLSIVLTTFGLVVFEVITSIDNAVINAEVLATMSLRARRWFLTWGILFAVFLVRGLLPWLIVWAAAPELGPLGAWSAALGGSPEAAQTIEEASPPLFALGGVFLIILALHWLFLEPKEYGLPGERQIERHGVWFFAIVSLIVSTLTWFALKHDDMVAFGVVAGSTVFFIVHGFRENAAEHEQRMLQSASGGVGLSDWSKIFYLEVLDASFSIDGVLGAFAFTLSVPVILAGNGVGAIVVRYLTVRGVDRVKNYRYLKNGAMYSIMALGAVMLAEAFGAHVPEWMSPVVTFALVGYFFAKSVRQNSEEAGSERRG
jgi:hypothetical protein